MQPKVFSKEHPLKNDIDTLILFMECSNRQTISLDELLDYSHAIAKKK